MRSPSTQPVVPLGRVQSEYCQKLQPSPSQPFAGSVGCAAVVQWAIHRSAAAAVVRVLASFTCQNEGLV